MNKLSKEKLQQLIGVIVGALAVIFLLWYLVISKFQTDRGNELKKVAEEASEVEKEGKVVARSKEIQDELDLKMKELDKVESKMASGDLNPWMRDLLIEFQKQFPPLFPLPNANTPPTIIPVGVFPDFPYKAADYKVDGTAHYHEFGRFLADFENTYPYIRVQNLTLFPDLSAVTDDHEKLVFQMEVVTLVKPLPPAPK